MGNYIKVDKKYFEIQKEQRLGETNITHQGRKIKIVEYIDATHITVEFEDGIRKNTSYKGFKLGTVKYPNSKIVRKKPLEEERKNMIVTSKEGFQMFIAEYNSSADIIVEFIDEFHTRVHTAYKCFIKGNVKNPNIVGKYGERTGDKYPTKINNKRVKEYQAWRGILERTVYSYKRKNTEKCYKDVNICEEWLYYPNFYEWANAQENYDKWKNDTEHRWDIDKDILSDQNYKIYSPETCCFVPAYLNRKIARKDTFSKKENLPVGISQRSNYYFYVDENKKRIKFNTIEEAQKARESYIKESINKLAEEAYFKGDITKKCYEGLLKYQINTIKE